VTEVAEQGQGWLLARGGGRVISRQLLHQAQVANGVSFTPPVTNAAGQLQGLLVAGGGGRVVPRQNAQEAQLVQGVRLAGLVTDFAVQRQCPARLAAAAG
jgi:hypothetical protein